MTPSDVKGAVIRYKEGNIQLTSPCFPLSNLITLVILHPQEDPHEQAIVNYHDQG